MKYSGAKKANDSILLLYGFAIIMMSLVLSYMVWLTPGFNIFSVLTGTNSQAAVANAAAHVSPSMANRSHQK